MSTTTENKAVLDKFSIDDLIAAIARRGQNTLAEHNAREQAAVMKAIAAQPKRELLPADVAQLANELGNDGVPKAAAVKLARRLVAVPADYWQHVQRLEGRVIELEKEVAALRSARR